MVLSFKEYLLLKDSSKDIAIMSLDLDEFKREFSYKLEHTGYSIIPYSKNLIKERVYAHSSIFNVSLSKSGDLFKSQLKSLRFIFGNKFLLLDEDINVIGTIDVYNHFGCRYIANFGIVPNERQKGLGYLLLVYTLQNVNSDKVLLKVKKDNQSALNLYNSIGFKIV